MSSLYCVGSDVHKKVIAYCVKTLEGTLVEEGSIVATMTGRACDEEEFVKELEAKLGRSLMPWKRGPKPKAGENNEDQFGVVLK